MGTLNFDRYHAAMGDASYKDVTRVHSKPLSETTATFYCTQRKLPFAPVLGHERLIRLLVDSQIDRPRLRFLEQDRGGLQRFAKAIEDIQFAGSIRAVHPGTIMFPQQPIADITGKFGLTQAQEIKFEHAFDLPMTTASVAMQFRMAAGNRWLSDFSLRRNGDIERAVDIATYAFIGGFNDTSNMEAAHRLDIPAVGTIAHYWQQAYLEYMTEPEIEPRTGQPKHFEQVAFERWIDAKPTLKASNSLDKITLPGRLQVFRGIDSQGNYVADVTGLDDEQLEIPGAVRVERLLEPFWEHGQYSPIPSIEKQKAFVMDQMKKFGDLHKYPFSLSDKDRKSTRLNSSHVAI